MNKKRTVDVLQLSLPYHEKCKMMAVLRDSHQRFALSPCCLVHIVCTCYYRCATVVTDDKLGLETFLRDSSNIAKILLQGQFYFIFS